MSPQDAAPDTPRISVVMPVYNGGPYLRASVESILAQTFGDFEFLIVNDGSTDGSGEVLDEFAQRDARVRIFHQENKGMNASNNRACAEARGEFIARMDDDDISHPERFQKQIAFMDAHPDVGILGTRVSYINAEGEPTPGEWPKWAPPGVNGWDLLFKTCLCHPTTLMRRAVLADLNFYRPDAPYADDYDLWSRALFTTRLANLKDKLFTRRKWDGAVTSKHAAAQEQTVFNAMQIAHAKLLGRDVPMETVEVVRDIARYKPIPGVPKADNAPERLEEAAHLVHDLYNAYLGRFTPDAESEAGIRRDAAAKLVELARRARPQSTAAYLAIMNLLLRVEPRSMVKEVGTQLKRKVSGT